MRPRQERLSPRAAAAGADGEALPLRRLRAAWRRRAKRRAAGIRLKIKGARLWARGAALCSESAERTADDGFLPASASRSWAAGSALCAQGDRLRAEGARLWAEAASEWAEAVLETAGDVPMRWVHVRDELAAGIDGYGLVYDPLFRCELGNGMTFEPRPSSPGPHA